MTKVELDKKALFALASDTRVDILRAMQPMRRTVTQLAEAMGIDKAAVHRHLKKLVEGGLAKRHDDHGFVYYGLSWKSRDLLNPNDNTKVIILLASSIVMIAVAMAVLVAGLSSLGDPSPGGLPFIFPGTDEATYEDEQSRPLGGDAQPGPLVSYAWIIPATILPAGAILLLSMAWRIVRRPVQRAASSPIEG